MARKIKNPEKYIKRLKQELAEAWQVAENWRQEMIRERGKTQVVWSNFTDSQSCTSSRLGGFRAGNTVLITGTVTKVEETFDPACNNRWSKIEYIVKETRIKDK